MESRATASIVVWRYSIAPAVQPPCISAAEISRNQNVKDSRRGVRQLRTPLRFCNAMLLAHDTVAIHERVFGHRSLHDRAKAEAWLTVPWRRRTEKSSPFQIF